MFEIERSTSPRQQRIETFRDHFPRQIRDCIRSEVLNYTRAYLWDIHPEQRHQMVQEILVTLATEHKNDSCYLCTELLPCGWTCDAYISSGSESD